MLFMECVPVRLRNMDSQESRLEKNRRFGDVDMVENGEHQMN